MSEEKKSNTSGTIGIDLGTTYSCVYAYRNGDLNAIVNKEGDRTTPSVVAFEDDGSRLVGSSACHKLTSNPEKVVYDAKRLIGRGYDNKVLASSIKKWPFKLVRWDSATQKPTNTPAAEDAIDNMKIEITDSNNNPRYYDPIEISGAVLGSLKKSAEDFFSHPVEKAVITVPAHFGDNQKIKTKQAAMIAGFKEENIRLLNEPTAAAISHVYDRIHSKNKKSSKEEKVLVFDLGGGTFDVSLISFEMHPTDGTITEVLNTGGDTFLGGVDFDNAMYDHCLKMFINKNKSKHPELSEDAIKIRSRRRLRVACEKAKRVFMNSKSTTVSVECFYGDLNLNETITLALFEMLCDKYFKKCLDIVKGCLLGYKNQKVEFKSDGLLNPSCLNQVALSSIDEAKNEIDRVLLVGGSSRIPKIEKMLREFFGNKIDKSSNPDEAIARGAAYHAALIFGDNNLESECPMLLLDSVPLNISIETLGGIATTIIEKNTTFPYQGQQVFSTAADNQTSVSINIFEGLSEMVKDNNQIGEFTLTGIAPAKRGIPQIEVTCDVDASGLLTVTAKDKASNIEKSLQVSNDSRKISADDIEKMTQRYKEFEAQDKIAKQRAEAKNNFDSMLYQATETLSTSKPQFDAANRQNDFNDLQSQINQFNEWSVNNPEASLEAYQQKTTELTNLLKNISQPGAGPAASEPMDGPKVDEVD